MKRLDLLSLVVLPATLFLIGSLHAADAPPTSTPPSAKVVAAPETPKRMGPMTADEILKRFDQNGDGKLDEEERAQAHETMLDDQVQRETAKAQAAIAAAAAPAPGGNSSTPVAAAAKTAEAKPNRKVGWRDEIFKRADVNQDGKVDDAEWTTIAPTLRAQIETAPHQLKRYDKNGDGRLDDAEWAAAAKQIRRSLNQTANAERSGKETPATH